MHIWLSRVTLENLATRQYVNAIVDTSEMDYMIVNFVQLALEIRMCLISVVHLTTQYANAIADTTKRTNSIYIV